MIINKKYQKICIVAVNAFLMAGILSFAMLFYRAGWTDGFFMQWMNNWLIAYIVAVPSAWIAPKVTQKILSKITFQ